MKTRILGPLLLLSMATGAAAQDAAPAPAPEASTSLRARISDEAVKQAVRETLEQDTGPARPGADGAALSGDGYRAFSRTFSEARKPSCLGPDALKHQPASFSTRNWNFSAGALLALPFWGAAILRGKCN